MKKLFYLFLNGTKFADYIEFYWIAYFIIFWVFPEAILWLDPEAGRAVEFHIFLEFLFGHASVAIATTYLPKSKLARTIFFCVLSLFYVAFFVALAFQGAWLPGLFFLVYLIEKFRRVSKKEGVPQKIFAFEMGVAGARMGLYLLSTIVAMLPWPELGIGRVDLGLTGSGEFIDYPQKLMAWFVTYYIAIAFLENKWAPKFWEKLSSSKSRTLMDRLKSHL